ncbi:MAG: cupin domain-containing protein [Pseudomonadales bacterium]
MPAIEPVDPQRRLFRVHRDLTVTTAEHRQGPPERIDGMSVGIVTLTADAPHGGEMHPDGDEILYVISGHLRVTGDSAPDTSLELGPGDACVVRRGEWHRVRVLAPTRLLHVTPGPGGEHRPVTPETKSRHGHET